MPQSKCERLQGGFTLVELMVAMLISLLLMGGVIQVFSSSSKSYRNHEGLSRIQENGRFAMEFLTREIRMADFWGCANTVSKVANNLDPLNGGTNWQYNFGIGGVGGTDGGGNAPDTITMRGAVGSALGVQPPFGPQASSNLKVPPNNGLAQGDVVKRGQHIAGLGGTGERPYAHLHFQLYDRSDSLFGHSLPIVFDNAAINHPAAELSPGVFEPGFFVLVD